MTVAGEDICMCHLADDTEWPVDGWEWVFQGIWEFQGQWVWDQDWLRSITLSCMLLHATLSVHTPARMHCTHLHLHSFLISYDLSMCLFLDGGSISFWHVYSVSVSYLPPLL